MGFHVQKISSGDKTQVNYAYSSYKSMTLTNTHSSSVNVSLYVTSKSGSNGINLDITDTDTDVNLGAGYLATVDSQVIVVDNGGTAGTSDMFLNEKVYLSTGKLVGTCTTFGSATSLTFSGGLNNSLANNDSLYTGTRYHILKNVEIPAGIALKLQQEDFSYNTNYYNLYIDSSNASGYIDIITRA